MSAFLDGYIQLAHAIVAVAAESYKYTLLAVKNHTRSDSVFRRKEELESFFLSEWFGLLSGLDGRYFIPESAKLSSKNSNATQTVMFIIKMHVKSRSSKPKGHIPEQKGYRNPLKRSDFKKSGF